MWVYRLQTSQPSASVITAATLQRAAVNMPVLQTHTHTTHTTVLLLVWNMSGSTRVSRHQKGKTKKVKTNLDLLEQETVSGSGICWAIWKSAPHADNHANTPPLSFFTGRMPFLTPNQQRLFKLEWQTAGLLHLAEPSRPAEPPLT